MDSYASISCCNMNQWALDFDDNLKRVTESIIEAKKFGAKLRVGSELELCAYGCEDHFFELDTFDDCWESLSILLLGDLSSGILCITGMPVIYNGVRYNCSIYFLDGKILLIRPKCHLTNDGNYRESRYFAQWDAENRSLETFELPNIIKKVTGQKATVIGIGILSLRNAKIASEICEELWVPHSLGIDLSLNGVDIICNSSASYYQIGKYKRRLNHVTEISQKCGGIYIYSNQVGCDGGTSYYDGSAMIVINGELVAQGSQFTMKPFEVIHSIVDIRKVHSHRASVSSFMNQSASLKNKFSIIEVDFSLSPTDQWYTMRLSPVIQPRVYDDEEELCTGAACWLWDYLRRSYSSGFFVPLSGGIDSASIVVIVGHMCVMLSREIREGNQIVLQSLETITGIKTNDKLFPRTCKDLCSRLLHTSFLGSENTTSTSRDLAYELATEIGCYHTEGVIDGVFKAFLHSLDLICRIRPKFIMHGGTVREDLSLQNLQARIRMVFSYLLASLLPFFRGHPGWLLVLGTGNADECLVGYLTKYDCSSGDINPVGSFPKSYLKKLLIWANKNEQLGYLTLRKISQRQPTAELRPISNDGASSHLQTDEEDLGMSYAELDYIGSIRKKEMCGPVSLFVRLIDEWGFKLSVSEIAGKVKHFFQLYARNRHKMSIMTPTYHADLRNLDNQKFDVRPILYNRFFSRQFRMIDRLKNSFEVHK